MPELTNVATRIAYLSDTPELVPLLAEWHDRQWRHLTGAPTLEQRKARLQQHLQRTAIPTTFVAWRGDQPVGSGSLVANDMSVLPEWIPWLANVFVLPEHRRHGVGSMLVQRVAAETVRLGYPRLYLYTQDQVHLYETLGWQISHQLHYRGAGMTVMIRDLIANPPPAEPEPFPTPNSSAAP